MLYMDHWFRCYKSYFRICVLFHLFHQFFLFKGNLNISNKFKPINSQAKRPNKIHPGQVGHDFGHRPRTDQNQPRLCGHREYLGAHHGPDAWIRKGHVLGMFRSKNGGWFVGPTKMDGIWRDLFFFRSFLLNNVHYPWFLGITSNQKPYNTCPPPRTDGSWHLLPQYQPAISWLSMFLTPRTWEQPPGGCWNVWPWTFKCSELQTQIGASKWTQVQE